MPRKKTANKADVGQGTLFATADQKQNAEKKSEDKAVPNGDNKSRYGIPTDELVSKIKDLSDRYGFKYSNQGWNGISVLSRTVPSFGHVVDFLESLNELSAEYGFRTDTSLRMLESPAEEGKYMIRSVMPGKIESLKN